MKTNIHLISMPWKHPFSPSIQLGCLKAFLETRFTKEPNLSIHTYSAHLPIIINAFGKDHEISRNRRTSPGESPYFLLTLKRFNPFRLKDAKRHYDDSLKRILEEKHHGPALADTLSELKQRMRSLEKATVNFIENELVPRLDHKSINIIGFSVSFSQLYSSLFAYHYLLDKYAASFNPIFLIGGSMTGSERTLEILRKYEKNIFTIVAEGELRLQSIIELCLEADPEGDFLSILRKRISELGENYIYLGNTVRSRKHNIQGDVGSTRHVNLSDVPAPDYNEYFESLHKLFPDAKAFRAIKRIVVLPLEGSRGCPHKCDFCGLNIQWRGYRRKSPDIIQDQVLILRKKYRIGRIQFVDNTCDPWVSAFSDIHLQCARGYSFGCEMRAEHDERYWVKMYLAGFRRVQLGVEALSDTLLKRMNKGTTVINNLRALKYCQEIGFAVAANLIMYHPKTTHKDVYETKRVLSLIPHFVKFSMSDFTLAENSPIFDSLSQNEKRHLRYIDMRNRNSALSDLYSSIPILPKHLHLPCKTLNALRELRSVYARLDNHNIYLIEKSKTADRIVVFDNRFGYDDTYTLDKVETLIYNVCHKGLTVAEIAQATGLRKSVITNTLDELIGLKLMISVKPHYLSLAQRPIEELINNYKKMSNSASATKKR